MTGSSISLAFDFAWREIHSKYRGSFLGWTWMILNPVITLTLYTLVFSGILGIHLSNNKSGMTDYAISFWAAMTMYSFFSNVVSTSPSIISGHANYVKKVIFPVPVLVISKVIADGFFLGINLVILALLICFRRGGLPMTAWLLPVLLAPCIVFCAGVAFVLSALGAYLPDTKELTNPVLQVLLALSPVAYPLSMIPESFRRWIWLNPVTSMTEPVRNVLADGKLPDWQPFLIFCACALFVWAAGFRFFSKVRTGFSDVL